MFALNQRSVHVPVADPDPGIDLREFIEKAVARVERIKAGHPLDLQTMIGAQASQQQLDKILSYIDIGRGEGAQCLTGGERTAPAAELGTGYYVKPTMLLGNNKMRVFQEEIFGPVASVMTFRTSRTRSNSRTTRSTAGAGVWTRNGTRAYRMGREVEAGRVDQLLPPVSRACGVRWLQAVGDRPRDAQDGAVELSADEVPAGELSGRGARVLLIRARAFWPAGGGMRRPVGALSRAVKLRIPEGRRTRVAPGGGGCLPTTGARMRAARPTGDPEIDRFRPFAFAIWFRPRIVAVFAGNDTDGRLLAAASRAGAPDAKLHVRTAPILSAPSRVPRG